MGVAWRMGQAAARDHLYSEYDRAVRAAGVGDTYAKEWLAGWYAFTQ